MRANSGLSSMEASRQQVDKITTNFILWLHEVIQEALIHH